MLGLVFFVLKFYIITVSSFNSEKQKSLEYEDAIEEIHKCFCKTASFTKAKEWGDSGTDQIPESYLIQVAHYAAISGANKIDIAVLIGGQDFRIYTYNKNKDLENKIIKIGVNFWNNHIEKGIPPKCVNTRDTFNLFPQSNNKEILAQNDIIAKLEELKIAKMSEEQIQKTIEKLRSLYICTTCKDNQ